MQYAGKQGTTGARARHCAARKGEVAARIAVKLAARTSTVNCEAVLGMGAAPMAKKKMTEARTKRMKMTRTMKQVPAAVKRKAPMP